MVRGLLRAHCNRPVKYTVPSRNPPVRERVNLMNSRLRNGVGRYRLLVDRKCKELIEDFGRCAGKARW